MTTRIAARATAFGLSVLVTLAMLGSVNFLAMVDQAPAGLIAATAQPKA